MTIKQNKANCVQERKLERRLARLDRRRNRKQQLKLLETGDPNDSIAVDVNLEWSEEDIWNIPVLFDSSTFFPEIAEDVPEKVFQSQETPINHEDNLAKSVELEDIPVILIDHDSPGKLSSSKKKTQLFFFV